MKTIGIVTDSGANLPSEVAKGKDIQVVPLQVSIGENVYREGVDLEPKKFYEMLEKMEEMPVVMPPSPRDFCEVFEKMKNDGYKGVVCLTISANICPAYQAACEARDMVRPFPVVVLDSHFASMSQGFMVLEAERAACEGLPITDIVERVWQMRPRLQFYALAGMLHYLVQTGRVSKGVAYMRALMNLTPILTIDWEEGILKSCARARSRQHGIDYIINKMEEAAREKGGIRAAVLYGGDPGEAEQLCEVLSQKLGSDCAYIQPMTAAIGCQTGPGIIGVSFCAGDPPQVFES